MTTTANNIALLVNGKTVDTYTTKHDALDALLRAITDYSLNNPSAEADNLTIFGAVAEVDEMIAECREQGAEEMAARYEAVKADFAPGVWAMEGYATPRLIYTIGDTEFSHGDTNISITDK